MKDQGLQFESVLGWGYVFEVLVGWLVGWLAEMKSLCVFLVFADKPSTKRKHEYASTVLEYV